MTVVPISTPSGGGAVRVGARVVETPPARGDEPAHADQQGTVEVVAHQLRGRQPLLDVAQRRGEVARAALQLGQRVLDQGPGPVLAQLGEPAVLGEQHRACGDDLVRPAQQDPGDDVRSRLLRGVAAPRRGRACGVEQVRPHAAAHPELRPGQRGLALRDRGRVTRGPRGDEGGGGVPVGGRHGTDEDQRQREESLGGRPQAVASGLRECRARQLGRLRHPVLGLAHAGQPQQRFGAQFAARQLGHQLAEHRACGVHVLGPVPVLPDVDAPSDQRVAGRGRGEGHGPRRQHGRDVRRTPQEGAPRRLLHGGGDGLVGTDGRGGQVNGALVGIADEGGQPGVHPAALPHGQVGRGGRAHQRVREPDRGPVDLQQSLPDGLVQRVDGVVAQRGGQERGRGACGDRHHGERLLRGRAQRRDALGRDPQDTAGQRQRALVDDPLPAGRQRPPDLHRGERVSPAGGVDAPGEPARQLQPALLGEQRVDGVGVERAERDAVQPGTQRRPVEPEGSHRSRAPGGEHPDRLGRQPADDVAQHPVRRAVEPADVVHGEHERPLRRQRADHAERGDTHRMLVGDGPGIGGAQQRDVERRALRRWQRERGVRAHGLEQVAQGDERQVRLALDGGDGEHAVSARDGCGLRRSPDRGLADAGVALEEERGRRHLHRVHEGRHLRERGVPPEDDGCRVLPEHRRASCRGGRGPRVAPGSPRRSGGAAGPGGAVHPGPGPPGSPRRHAASAKAAGQASIGLR